MMKKASILISAFALLMLGNACKDDGGEQIADTETTQTEKNTVTLDTSKLKPSEIELYELGSRDVPLKRAVPGVAMAAPNYISMVSAPLDGIVSKLYLNEGERVRKGQVILEIESLEYGNLLSDFLKADSELSYQKGRLQRSEQLAERGVAPESELESVRAEKNRAEANLKAVRARLLALGMSPAEIERLKSSENIEPHLLVRSKISGIIDEHNAELGMPVNAYEQLASVVNTEKLLVKAWLSPEDLNSVSVGDSVSISRRTSPEEGSIYSVISTINPALDKANQSVIANIYIRTGKNWPVPGENVRVELSSEMNGGLLAVPRDAVTYLGDKEVVFVKTGDLQFQVRQIQSRYDDNQYSFVSDGLQKGEKVAVSEVFTLKSMLRFNEFSD